MTYKTVEGTLHPNGTVTLTPEDLPARSTRVMVTFLDAEDEALSDLGDYQEQLQDYEERLARGEIQWR